MDPASKLDKEYQMMSESRPGWAKNLNEKDFDLVTRGVYTTSAAAAFTGLAESSIRQAIARCDLKARKQGKGWRIQERDLVAFFHADEA